MSQINDELTEQQAVARIMRLAVNCADKHWDAACGDDPITITADEAFALFLLCRFTGSHPTFHRDDGTSEKYCMAQAAVAFVRICLQGICPDCGHRFDESKDGGHNETNCDNHCNEYPPPDTIEASNIPHPPKHECH